MMDFHKNFNDAISFAEFALKGKILDVKGQETMKNLFKESLKQPNRNLNDLYVLEINNDDAKEKLIVYNAYTEGIEISDNNKYVVCLASNEKGDHFFIYNIDDVSVHCFQVYLNKFLVILVDIKVIQFLFKVFQFFNSPFGNKAAKIPGQSSPNSSFINSSRPARSATTSKYYA